MSELPVFPDGFRWGAATAAYQIEGAVHEDGRGVSIWDTFTHTPGTIVDDENGDVACDHYHRYAEDVRLARDLGLNTYRFSIAWPRVLPEGTGRINQAGLDFYKRLTDELFENGITPCATLYHWDLPQALQDEGGWTERDTVDRFGEYVGVVAAALGDRIPMWITVNEPQVAAFLGYGAGQHAPGRTEGLGALEVVHHFLLAHGRAVEVLRDTVGERGEVGITLNVMPAYPASATAEDAEAAGTFDSWMSWLFTEPLLRGRYPGNQVDEVMAAGDWVRDGDLEGVAAPIDFLGLNYYQPVRVAAVDPEVAADAEGLDMLSSLVGFQLRPWDGVPHSTMGWPIVPDGLRTMLTRFKDRYGSELPPIHITENGIATEDKPGPDGEVDDPDRIAYVDAHLRVLRQAIDDGVDVRGYFHWSLLDNFEWAEGYAARFGLVYVDYPTQRRTPKSSYWWYRGMISA